MIGAILEKLESNRPFTDQEAWNLFRIAAIGEAGGWSLLIAGIAFKHFVTPANNTPVLIAGQVHGTIFLVYITAVIVLYSSLRWSRKRTVVAGLASIPPYGSLIFEQWAAYKRRGEALKTYRAITVRAIIIQGDKLLAVQPKDNGFWNLPGGPARSNESVEQALRRIVADQTGVAPVIGRLAYLLQYRDKSTQRLEMFFSISNTSGFQERALIEKAKASTMIDEIRYIKPRGNQDLRPVFLSTEPVVVVAKKQNGQVKFISL